MRGRNARDQRGLSGVGKTHQAYVREQLQLEAQTAFFAGKAGFMLRGGLMGGGSVSSVAFTALAAVRDDEPVARLGEVVQQLARLEVVNHGPDGSRHVNRRPFAAFAVTAFAMPAALRFVLRVEAEMQQ